MNNLKALVAAAFESAPAANFRDVNFDALLQELHSSTNQRHTSELGLHVLALMSSHIKYDDRQRSCGHHETPIGASTPAKCNRQDAGCAKGDGDRSPIRGGLNTSGEDSTPEDPFHIPDDRVTDSQMYPIERPSSPSTLQARQRAEKD